MEEDIKRFASKNPEDFLDKYNSNIMKAVNKYSGSGVDKNILESKAESLAFNAAKTFKPGSSSFETHLFNNLKKLYGEVNNLQGAKRITEYRKVRYNENPEHKAFKGEQGYASGLEDTLGYGSIKPDAKYELKRIISTADLGEGERRVAELLLNDSTKDYSTENISRKLGITQDRVTKIKKQIADKIGPSLARNLGPKINEF